MSIRMTGLTSGLDTDSIVEALMSAQRMKQTKVENKKTKLEWKQSLWSDLNTSIYNFYKNTLSSIRLQSTYKTKAATSSDSSKVTATASSSAASGTYKVAVKSLASAQYVTSGVVSTTDGEDAMTSTKLTDLGVTAGTQITISGADGDSILTVTDSTKISDFVSACTDAGLTASFDTTQQRFFISSSDSGADQGFTITATTLGEDQTSAISNIQDSIGYDYLTSSQQSKVDSILDQLQLGEITSDEAMEKLDSYLETAKTSAVTSYYEDQLTASYESSYFTDGAVNETAKAALDAAGVDYSEMDDDELTEAVNSLISDKVAEDIATDEYQEKIAEGVTDGINGADDSFLSSSYLTLSDSLTSAVESYADTMNSASSTGSELSGLGLGNVTGSTVDESDSSVGMAVIAASDAVITVNGATLTSSNSTITVNGLTLNILDTTDSDISISVTNDTSSIYDTIKDFISEYNDLLGTMNDYYYADSASDYEVLTDDEKEAMSEDEIEKWEDKIKSSLLRRDTQLYSVISQMKNCMMATYTASDGKTYSLASLGITTSSDYTEYGLLHIKGDEDDSEYADEDNTLQAMLESDPDLVAEILTGLTSTLYSNMTTLSQSSTYSSVYTFYNDKEMNSQLSDYEDEIEEWESKLADLEDRYYSQFTAMETALASLSSQSSYISSLLGGTSS